MNLSGNPLDYLTAFLGGVALSFTPCVYPLIPVTAGFIGASSSGSKLKGLFLSLLYVTGVAITYSILGILASLTGRIFGVVHASPVVHFLAGIVIILFGLSMLDLFYLRLPAIFKAPQIKTKGSLGAIFLGMISGLMVSPCITPVLGSILVYLATRKNILYGAGLLFSFAYGMGLLLILIGTFSSILVNLPKPGKWMRYIKNFSAFILIVLGAYFIIRGIRRL